MKDDDRVKERKEREIEEKGERYEYRKEIKNSLEPFFHGEIEAKSERNITEKR